MEGIGVSATACRCPLAACVRTGQCSAGTRVAEHGSAAVCAFVVCVRGVWRKPLLEHAPPEPSPGRENPPNHLLAITCPPLHRLRAR